MPDSLNAGLCFTTTPTVRFRLWGQYCTLANPRNSHGTATAAQAVESRSMIPDPITTERLTLRPLTAADDADFLRFRGNADVTRYLSHAPLGPAENTARLDRMLAQAAASTAGWFNVGWAIVLRGTGEMIGDARTWNTDS